MKKIIALLVFILTVGSGCTNYDVPLEKAKTEEEICSDFISYVITPSTYEPLLTEKKQTSDSNVTKLTDDMAWYNEFCDKLETLYCCEDAYSLKFNTNVRFKVYLTSMVRHSISSLDKLDIILVEDSGNTKTYTVHYVYASDTNDKIELTDIYMITLEEGKITNADFAQELPKDASGIISLISK